jgi:hypothetical protein
MSTAPFSLRVEPTAGADIIDARAHACKLAQQLGLAWVEFNFNGVEWVAYPDGGSLHFGELGCRTTQVVGTDQPVVVDVPKSTTDKQLYVLCNCDAPYDVSPHAAFMSSPGEVRYTCTACKRRWVVLELK